MKSMQLGKYFKIIHPEYVILQIIPDTSIRNYNSSNIAGAIARMYKGIFERIKKIEKQYIVETSCKVAFFIDIRKTSVNFFFIIPEQYERLAKEKIIETWPKATIEVVESIQAFTDKALKYQLRYTKEDPLSLNVDKRNNEPLNNILSIIDVMEEGDRVGIFYNFLPISQRGWRKEYETTIQKIKNNEPIDKNKFDNVYIIKVTIINLLQILQDIISAIMDIFGVEKKQGFSVFETAITSLLIDDKKKLSSATLKKKDSTIISTQMIVLSDSENNIRKQNNAIAVLESFKTISEDNELTYDKLRSNFVYTDFKVKEAEENKLSVDECQNLIQIPGRELLLKYNNIRKIDVLETPIPIKLRNGVMCIGENIFKGNSQKAYLSIDEDYKYLTLCVIGPTRAGKTTLISNLSRDAINNGECTIIFDFCGNCELSGEVASIFPEHKVLEIDCSNFNKLQGLGYNEIEPNNNEIFEIYRCAKAKTMQLLTLVNYINADDNELKARMERYLESAAIIVFIQNGPVKDVFEILQNHILRHKYIDNILEEQKQNLFDYITALEELDEWSKETKNASSEIIGTKLSYVQGILNRVTKLKQNAFMELMLKKDCKNNINLVKEMQKSQLICIKMPEVMFSTEQEKDIYCTYWLTKIWGALQKRKWDYPEEKDRVKVNLIFDELYQVPNCQDFLRSKLSQIAKFSCKPIISCHYLGQIPIIRNELKAANSSYMLIAGCDKDNFRELKEELEPYTLEDLLNLKRYHSLNLIKYEGGWAKFITKLPPPLK